MPGRLAFGERARDKKDMVRGKQAPPSGATRLEQEESHDPMPSRLSSPSGNSDKSPRDGEMTPSSAGEGPAETLPLEILLGDEPETCAAERATAHHRHGMHFGRRRLVAAALAGVSAVLLILSLGLIIGDPLFALGIAGALAGLAGSWVGVRMLTTGSLADAARRGSSDERGESTKSPAHDETRGEPDDEDESPADPGPQDGKPSSPALESGLTRALFDDAPLGVALVTREGKLIDANRLFGRFATGRQVRPGDALLDMVVPADRNRVEAALALVFSGGGDGKPQEVGFATTPPHTGRLHFTRIAGHEPPTALVHLIDTTRHKSLEQQFVQAQKMQAVGQLAGGIAHDFNNLLTAIIGFCDLLLVRHGPGDPSFADVMQIKQNSNRAANLVRQLLAFSRQQTMRPKVLVVTDVLSELSNLLRRLIGETIELKMVHGRDVGAVNVDQGQLEQVIINLAVNARDAMPDGGTLTIRTRRVADDDPCLSGYSMMPPDEYVLIEVADTGTGIAPEHLDKIFEPFFTTKEVGRGTGLGLSTVYGIIKQTGGFIFAESTPGEGSTFRVFLPLHRAPDRESRTSKEAEAAPRDLTGKETILLVEDEDAVRLFARRALVNKGYHVLEAASGEEALEIANRHDGPIDLLISDVVMPNMDGPTLVHEIRKRSPATRIVFISGYAEDVFRKRLAHGEQDFAFLPKPFSLKQLAECIKETLGEG